MVAENFGETELGNTKGNTFDCTLRHQRYACQLVRVGAGEGAAVLWGHKQCSNVGLVAMGGAGWCVLETSGASTAVAGLGGAGAVAPRAGGH